MIELLDWEEDNITELPESDTEEVDVPSEVVNRRIKEAFENNRVEDARACGCWFLMHQFTAPVGVTRDDALEQLVAQSRHYWHLRVEETMDERRMRASCVPDVMLPLVINWCTKLYVLLAPKDFDMSTVDMQAVNFRLGDMDERYASSIVKAGSILTILYALTHPTTKGAKADRSATDPVGAGMYDPSLPLIPLQEMNRVVREAFLKFLDVYSRLDASSQVDVWRRVDASDARGNKFATACAAEFNAFARALNVPIGR